MNEPIIFPSLIDALTVIFGVSRMLRGQLKFEDPNEDLCMNEVFGIKALSEKAENGPVIAVSIEELDGNHLHPKQIRKDIVPKLLVHDFDFVFHIFDALLYEAQSTEERNMLAEYFSSNKATSIGTIKKEAVLCMIYSKNRTMGKAVSTIPECIAFFRKNCQKPFPDCKYPTAIDALWNLYNEDAIQSEDETENQYNQLIEKELSTLSWN